MVDAIVNAKKRLAILGWWGRLFALVMPLLVYFSAAVSEGGKHRGLFFKHICRRWDQQATAPEIEVSSGNRR